MVARAGGGMGIKKCVCRDEHGLMYGIVESLHCSLETNITCMLSIPELKFKKLKHS